jgi:hyperosmotically inducible protein
MSCSLHWYALLRTASTRDRKWQAHGVGAAIPVRRSSQGQWQGTCLAQPQCMKSKLFSSLVLSLSLLASGSALAATQDQGTPPDNTKVNKQPGKTADQQSQDKGDLALVKQIRAAIVKDKTLSTNAHNCKVITNQGVVTLRGPVKSDEEKTAVEKIAVDIAGEGKVTNELTIPKPRK